jgi:ATP-dependent RNA helicase DDX41
MPSVHVADQEERSRSVEAFRKGQKDVLVATDVASKGLDFADVQHVINYDMPDDVENYGEFSILCVALLSRV